MESGSAPARLRSLPSWLINQASTHAQRAVGDAFASVASRRYHYSVLAALDEFGGASQAQIGRRCGIDRSDMVAVVTELTNAGTIRRVVDPDDRRRNIITLTPSGRRHLRKLDALLEGVQRELLEPLTAGERDQLVALLSRVVDHHSHGHWAP